MKFGDRGKKSAIKEARQLHDQECFYPLDVSKLTPEEKTRVEGEQGVYVERAEGPAAAAGLRRGDVILAIGSTPVASVSELVELSEKSGKTVALLVQRDKQRTYVPVQTG